MSTTEIEIVKPDRYEKHPSIRKHETELLELEAKVTLEFVTKWGMVAGMPDGEDSSGRAKQRLATPEEVVDRACTVTELLFAEIRKRKDWIVSIPNTEEIKGMFPKEGEE